MSVAFLFSGQGAQTVGMGEELYRSHAVVRKVIDEGSHLLGEDLTSLSFKENEKMNWTPYTQPLLLAWSHAFSELLKEAGIFPQAVAGLSLGEYTALLEAKVFSYEEAVPLVHRRGKFMEEACPKEVGAMSAVMGAERKTVEEVCSTVSMTSYVAPANYNMPGQIVIGGEKEGVEKASALLLERGAKKVIPLTVSGPFHTALLKPAATQLQQELEPLLFNSPVLPVYSNTLAKRFETATQIKQTLVKQVMEPVQFEDMIHNMIHDGVDTFVEVGPGKVLSKFVKKIDRNVLSLNVQDEKSLEKTLQTLRVEVESGR